MKKTQKQIVKEILKRDGSISNHWAIDSRLTTRLAAIIGKLREEGMDIHGESVPGSKDFVYTYKPKPKPVVRYVNVDGVMHARVVQPSV